MQAYDAAFLQAQDEWNADQLTALQTALHDIRRRVADDEDEADALMFTSPRTALRRLASTLSDDDEDEVAAPAPPPSVRAPGA